MSTQPVGPWTRYQVQTGTGDEEGPWTRYQQHSAPVPGTGLNRYGELDTSADLAPAPTRLSTEIAKEALPAMAEMGKGMLKGAGSTMSAADDWSRKHLPSFMTNTGMGFSKPEDIPAEKAMLQPKNTMQSVGKGVEQAGEFLIPGAAEEEAINAATKIAPRAAIMAKIAVPAMSSGVVNKVQGGNFGTGAATGVGGVLVGAGLRKIAPMLAETALGVQGLDRTYGRTPGEAILEDTSGFRPSTVRRTAQQTMNRLRPQVESIAHNSQTPADFGPMYQSLDDKIATASNENAPATMADLQSVKDHFTTPKTPGAAQFVAPPSSPQTSAEGALNLKRGLSKEFINRWTPEKGTDIEKAARYAYGQAADAFHEAVPEAKALDQRMSSLAPIIDRAGMASRRAGVVQGVLDRFRRPTGALAPLLAGAYSGGHAFGFPGALVGGAAGAVIPHILASPTVQMFGARGLASPLLQRGVIPLMQGGAMQFARPDVDHANETYPAVPSPEPLHLRHDPLTPEVVDPLKPAISKIPKKGTRQ